MPVPDNSTPAEAWAEEDGWGKSSPSSELESKETGPALTMEDFFRRFVIFLGFLIFRFPVPADGKFSSILENLEVTYTLVHLKKNLPIFLRRLQQLIQSCVEHHQCSTRELRQSGPLYIKRLG